MKQKKKKFTFAKTSKFLLLKVLNNNRIRFNKNPKIQRNGLRLFDFFSVKENLINLF